MSRFSGYESTQHVLDEVRKFHEKLIRLYGDLQSRASDSRAQMLLEFLIDREERLAQALENYQAGAAEKVLANRFQIPFPEDPDRHLRSLEHNVDLDTEGVSRLATESDEFLGKLFEHVRDSVRNKDVKELFQNLIDAQEDEKIALSKALNSFREI